MRKVIFLAAAALISGLLTGCGGSSGPATPLQTTRVLAGFVYAKGNTLGAGAEVVVTASANPPTGYFAPSSGTVTLSVADGTLTRSPDSEGFDMSISNAIVVTAKAAPNSTVAVAGSNIVYNGDPKTLNGYNVNLGAMNLSGTVETITSPDAPSYTPGDPVALQYTINGNAPASPKELFIAGAPAGSGGDRTLSMVALDSNGVINPAATFTVSSTTTGVGITGAGASRTLSPGSAANSDPEGDTTITIQLDNANVTGSFLANFSYGTVGTVLVTPSAAQLLWNTAGAPATITIDVNVKNTFGANMLNQTVDLTDPGKVDGSNNWITGAGAAAFAAPSGVTDANGNYSTTLSAPVSAVPGGGLDLTPKGDNTITATVATVPGTGNVKVIRPLDSVHIVGPARLDVTETSAAGNGAGAYYPDSAVDVDGATPPLTDYPALALTYTVTNTAGGALFGNTGDQAGTSAATASIMPGAGNENRVLAGPTAGQFTMQVTAGVTTPSNIVTTEVYGDPAKIFLNPDTNTTNAIPGALGNYTGTPGSQVNASFTLLDSAGHTLPSSEFSYTSTFTLQAITGGNVTTGGFDVNSFTLTFGPTDGLLTIALNSGVWNGQGGALGHTFNISKDIGHDSN